MLDYQHSVTILEVVRTLRTALHNGK